MSRTLAILLHQLYSAADALLGEILHLRGDDDRFSVGEHCKFVKCHPVKLFAGSS
jgi:hypothetical protein